jgi:glycosyltransferase involved in cell wall biosynthesis
VQRQAANVSVDLHVESITDDKRLREVYSQARAFVYAPLQEALGMAPLEALACGTPVVAVREGGVNETVVDGVTGWTVDRDEAAFAERLDTLLNDEQSFEALRESGLEYVRTNWTWPKAVDRLQEHFETVCAA